MGTEATAETPTESNVLLFKMTGDPNRLFFPWPLNHKKPGKAMIGVGLPKDTGKSQPLILFFAPSGRLKDHATMESALHMVAQNYVLLPAFLVRENNRRVLQFAVRTEEETKKFDPLNPHLNPIETLNEPTIGKIVRVFDADDYAFITDRRHQEALADPAHKMVPETGGLPLLKQEQSHEGD